MQFIGFEAFQGVSGRLVGLGMIHSLWIGLLVAAVVELALQVRSRLSHEARHRILLAALLLVATGPVAATLLQRNLAARSTRGAPSNELIKIALDLRRPLKLPSTNDRMPIRSVNETKGDWARLLSIITSPISRLATAMQGYQPILVGAWLTGMFAFGCVLALGSRAVHRICRDARPAPHAIRERARRLARRARLRKPPRVMVHRRLNEPCLCGLFRPVILLPEHWLDCGNARLLDAILAHELAHARRLDHVINLAQRLLEVAMFFSPAVHWLSRCLRRQREFCADALAVRLTRDPLALAGALESVARLRLISPERPVQGSALGGQSISLLPRIQELLGMMPSRPRPRLWPFAALPAAGLVALIAATSSLSQEKAVADRPNAQLAPPQNSGPDVFSVTGSYGPVSRDGAPLDAPAPADFDRQICFEVRYISLDANPWREAVKDHIKLIKEEADVCAWIIDDKSLSDLLTLANRDHDLERPSSPEGHNLRKSARIDF